MVIHLKSIIGILAVLVGFLQFIPYFFDIRRGTVKPHVLSWFTWSLLTGLGFALLWLNGGGNGAWIFLFQSIACLTIALYACFRGEKKITILDWISFTAALITFVFYIFTKDIVTSAILAAAIDSLGFIPTFRKSYMKPREETVVMYLCSGIAFCLSILALRTYSFSTIFYPLVLAVTNLSFVFFLFIRRKVLHS
jgi:hypothetical protein